MQRFEIPKAGYRELTYEESTKSKWKLISEYPADGV
jgi:hypothetical protein